MTETSATKRTKKPAKGAKRSRKPAQYAPAAEGPAAPHEVQPVRAKRTGRPSKFRPEFCRIAESICRLGGTDADLATALGVTTSTVWRWQTAHADFCSSIKTAKEHADNRVERALYERAIGFEYDTKKVFQFQGRPVIVPVREKSAPDTTACIFWLKNRKPDAWKDRVTQESSGEIRVYLTEDDMNY